MTALQSSSKRARVPARPGGAAAQRSAASGRAKPRRRKGSSPDRKADGDSLVPSATALAAEALRTGILPAHQARRRAVLPREDEMICVGDPDDDSLANEYVGDETPGGSSPTPDQNEVDDIGRAYGLQEEDAGDFHAAGEILERRDHRRAELRPPKRRRY
jgi:hypothetical protein